MTGESAGPSGRLRLLLDSNVVIAVEPYAGVLEQGIQAGARLLRLANEQGHLLCVAPATKDDLLEGRDPLRRAQRVAELEKFHLLEEVPVASELAAAAGRSRRNTNDDRDLRILAALHAGGATHLVTDDTRLRRRAMRAGLGNSVLSLNDAVAFLSAFMADEAEPPPRITRPATYALNVDDPIFDGLRMDYGQEFNLWLNKVRRESDDRRCYLVEEGDRYAALALLKPEQDCDYDMPAPMTKISTFKVSDEHSGLKFGELLLKAILMDASLSDVTSLYVEVLPTHPELIDFLEAFGFRDSGHRSKRGEWVMVKELRPSDAAGDLTDLEYHIRYGPPALRLNQRIFVIPIEPRWHDQLFPERAPRVDSTQLELFHDYQVPVTHPWGNALRKAYLCNSVTTTIQPGDVVLFYRSHDDQSVCAVGIVEDVLRSANVDEVVQFVGRRTVYAPAEIAPLARSVRGVLAIRFRQDRFLDPPLPLAELQAAGVLKKWPQSITRLRQTGATWIRDQLRE